MTSSRYQEANEELRQRLCTQFEHLRYSVIDALTERGGDYTPTGRERDSEVVLEKYLSPALESLNTHLDPSVRTQAIQQAIEQLTANRSQQALAVANRDIYHLLKDGVPTEVRAEGRGGKETVVVRVINWNCPEKNDFLLVRNFWVNGQEGRSCLDFVGFVNGLPLLLPLVRAVGAQRDPLRYLYEHKICEYRRRFPQLFWYNALILLSDGSYSKLGSLTSPWERYTTWKRVISETEPGNTSLETMLTGTCEHTRLLDLVENFTLFSTKRGMEKIIAHNHQYLGVNAAFARLSEHKKYQGKIGVFWHTQGAGKSYSMIFLEQKVQRKLKGNWKFVIITDRKDLDKQIYENFVYTKTESEAAGLVSVKKVQDLKPHLRRNQRLLFTLIQKYQAGEGEQEYEKVTEDDEIIVIIDEAHRSEYATLAGNMRNALPNASFIGFTGTPLISDEVHRTQEVFGTYVSKYGFLQAIQDGVTVDLAYDNHTPELVLQFPEIARELHDLEERAGLSDRQKRELRRNLLRKDELLKSDERLDFVARDIVQHFMGRGYMGKGMVVCIDKLTTVRLHNRVQKEWQNYRQELEQRLSTESNPEERARIERAIDYMRETKMAVVFSESDQKDEKKALAEFNRNHPQEQIDFQPHYDLLLKSNKKLDEEFKDENNPLRLVFVCEMWMTGFDVPCLSTLYLDHPMKMHTLMQALARPNRVNGPEKTVGQVVDYVGIYEELLDALPIYGQPEEGQAAFEIPLTDKREFIAKLEQALLNLMQFCQQQGIDLSERLDRLEQAQEPVARKALFEETANLLVQSEDIKLNFLVLEGLVYGLYQAILPDKNAGQFKKRVYFYREVQRVIIAAMNCDRIDKVFAQGSSIVSRSLTIRERELRWGHPDDKTPLGQFNLSELNLDELSANLRPGTTYLQIERLLSLLKKKLQSMIHVNPRRVDYLERLQELIFKYNEGSANGADYPAEVIAFTRKLSEEEQRSHREGLSEEELAIADLLAAEVQLSAEDWQTVKTITRKLLDEIKASGDLVHSWYTKLEPNGNINSIIKRTLAQLPACYDDSYNQKCQETYQYIRVAYANAGDTGPLSA
jgi:type I restriction enzyme R subunit